MPKLQQIAVRNLFDRSWAIFVKGPDIGTFNTGLQYLIGKIIEEKCHDLLGPLRIGKAAETANKLSRDLRETFRDKEPSFRGDPGKDRLGGGKAGGRIPGADVLHSNSSWAVTGIC